MTQQKSLFDKLLVYILFHHRWVFVVFLLPISVVYNLYFYLRNWIIFKLNYAPHKHNEKVRNVQRQIREWKKNGAKTPMCTARPGWANTSLRVGLYKKTMTNIDVNLADVLEVDLARRVVRVEPLVTMGQITATLLPLGLTLPIVPELDDLTVGGLINGIGIETSSHIYGLFKDICVSLDVVTAEGELLHCTEKENTDLFHALPFSHGTLGFLVAAEITIVPAKKYVKMEYVPTYSFEEFSTAFEKSSKNKGIDFVEGLVFSDTEAVLMKGTLTDTAEWGKVNTLSHWWKPWFYVHVAEFLKKGQGVEYIPLRDYYHRHTRSLFWMIREIIPFGNHWLFRLFLGWASPPKVQLLKATQTKTMTQMYEDTNMLQDMLVPMNQLHAILSYVSKNMKMYPLWVCPHICFNKPGLIHPATGKDELYVDIGTYGPVGISDFHPTECTRAYEAFVRRAHGHQMLYADSYQTREEFAQMFDRSLYDRMRKALPDCMIAFPDVYDKTNRKARV